MNRRGRAGRAAAARDAILAAEAAGTRTKQIEQAIYRASTAGMRGRQDKLW
jgi:hypothetical protein